MSTDIKKLEPAYDFGDGGQSVQLHQGPTEICIDGNNYTGEGEVRLEFLPRANIRLYGYFKGVPAPVAMQASIDQKKISRFSMSGHVIEGVKLSSWGDATTQEFNVKWSPKYKPITGVGDDATQMTRVVFHVFNFVDFEGTRQSVEQKETGMHAVEHLDMACDEWQVELKALPSTKGNFKLLKEEGGYRLTHIGAISKPDGGSFTGKRAEECLNPLRFFLSFAKGGWCNPVCAVGFDAFGNRVWESWSAPREPWNNFLSWFDPYSSSQLASLFPGFMKRWDNEEWQDALHEVIYWYLNANQSSQGIDTGIILTQTAIERLSYEYSVKDKRLLTLKGFKDLWASDKFRLLFSSLRIPLDIPTETSKLQGLSSSGPTKWIDAPHALTEVRNSLVHPEHKHRRDLESTYFESWNLGLWYLEMGILAVCGYSGTYWNRLKQYGFGEVEDVPWKE